ncbi:MAG: MFS transporter, partial [Planctomycetaceae bacterium]
TISMVMLIAGLFDAVTDPSIGYFSDRYHARTGSRRPFVVLATPVPVSASTLSAVYRFHLQGCMPISRDLPRGRSRSALIRQMSGTAVSPLHSTAIPG